jgi:hypothetical protein
MSMKIRTYRDLTYYSTFQERFDYLSLRGHVGKETFGTDRYLNQRFYTSRQWRNVRHEVIVRDEGCDLGIPGYEIHRDLYIHHMNPITPEDIRSGNPDILDPELLITVTHLTHNAIHYGDQNLLPKAHVERHPGDTRLW